MDVLALVPPVVEVGAAWVEAAMTASSIITAARLRGANLPVFIAIDT
jgi:hypothetical protein